MRLILSIAGLLLIAGCASDVRVDRIIPEDITRIDTNSRFYEAIRIGSIVGGKKTNPLWSSEISNESFEAALRTALEEIGALSKLRSEGLRLSVSLDEIKQPFVGLDMTVVATVTYRLDNPAASELIFEKQFESSYTAKLTDHLYGVERLRLANEGAAKTSIEDFLAFLREQK